MTDILDEQLLKMYYYMKLSRSLEEKLEILYRQGELPGAIYLGIGQEACYVGSVINLKQEDTLSATHRDMTALLVKGITPRMIMAQHFGKVTSPTKGRGEDNYLGDLSVGVFAGVSMLPDLYPVSVGSALYFNYKDKKNVAMAICGEGATAKGDFHEALNWASIYNLGVVFLVVNNKYAYSTPTNLEMKVKSVADRAKAYDIESHSVDGNDVLAVYDVCREAVSKARNNGGPTLIEAKTMRIKGHAGHDKADYVPKAVLEKWAKKDPIIRFENLLLDEKILSEKTINNFENDIESQVSDATRFSKESPYPDPKDIKKGVYSEQGWH